MSKPFAPWNKTYKTLVENEELGLSMEASFVDNQLEWLDLDFMKYYDTDPVMRISVTGESWHVLLTEVMYGKYYAEGTLGSENKRLIQELNKCTMSELRELKAFFKDTKVGRNKTELASNLEARLHPVIRGLEKLFIDKELGDLSSVDIIEKLGLK